MKNSIKVITTELVSIGNKADWMEEEIGVIEDRNIEMIQRDEKKE